MQSPAVLCSDHPKILEEAWDVQKLPLNGKCKVLHLKRGIKAVTAWRERNQGIERLVFAFPDRNNFGEAHFAQESPDVFS